MASLTATNVSWSPTSSKADLSRSTFVDAINPGARSGYPWPSDPATNVSWSPSTAQASLARSIFVDAINPGARSGYPWPTDQATNVSWSPLKTKAYVGANLNHGYASIPQATASGYAVTANILSSAKSLPLITGSGAGNSGHYSSRSLPLITGSGTATTSTFSAVNVPLISAASTGYTDSFGDSAAALLMISATSYSFVPITLNSNTTLPLITGSGNGSEVIPPGLTLGTSALSVPLNTGKGTAGMQPAVSVPLITGSGSGYAGEVGDSFADQLPLITGSSVALVGAAGASAASLPTPVGSGGTPFDSRLSVPLTTGSGTGLVGAVGVSSTAKLQPVGSGTGRVDGMSTSSCAVMAVQGSSVALNGSVGLSKTTLSRIILASSGISGTVGSSTVVLPVMQGSGAVLVPVQGMSAAIQIPLIQARSTAQRSGAQQSTTVVMHTETQALSTYENYGFNSFARFNGMYLGASEDGIFALTGDTDDGALIDAMVRLGITDFGTEFSKRIDKMYVGYRADGDMVLRVLASGKEYEYPLQKTDVIDIHGNRVQIGKGLDSRYWQFELRNVAGADFELDAIRVTLQTLTRRNR